ncbi:MAG: Asp-tRNA(Asn)/Glu-tRNA(Gln) amidotransferase subunit GatA [Simkaniaceae bacterium]|nr:Asp-tRNA(Asn)/Glu-tRNA(Gln) amidotransferase subunit GatA [Simkaniaceae bacterium]
MSLTYDVTGYAIRERFLAGTVSASQIVSYYLNRIERFDPAIGGFVSLLKERVTAKARKLDEKRERGEPLGRLAGVPVAVKDNIHIEGERTTCASAFLTDYTAPFSATAIKRIEEEDGLLIGKTNLDEFAMGSSTEYSALQATHNPWNVERVPGGSSGGSAVAVSAGLCPIALGSDTGGSVRQPASFTGTVGFKPTYGRVSRFGLVAFCSSMDQIGPFAGSVRDIAMMMEVIGAHCRYDATSMPLPPERYTEGLSGSLRGKKVGVPEEFLAHLDMPARTLFDRGLEWLRSLGVTVVTVYPKLLQHAIATYYILSTAEASTNLSRFDGIRYGKRSRRGQSLDALYDLSRADGFGKEVKRRILLGTFVLSSGYREAYYKKAQKVRTLLIRECATAFKECDVIALPTTPTTAFPKHRFRSPVEMYLQDLFTVVANLAGIPAISLPTMLDGEGLPGSIQLLGPQRCDGTLLHFASELEKTIPTKRFTPPPYAKEVAS